MREGFGSDIQIGRPLPFAVYDLSGKLMLARGTTISDPAQYERLLSRGFLIGNERSKSSSNPNEEGQDWRSEEIPVFLAMRDIAHRIQTLHSQLLEGGAGNLPIVVSQLATRIEDLVTRDLDSALASMQLHMQEGDFGSRYVHAAALCWTLGRALGYEGHGRRRLIEAALVYDVALTPVARQLNGQTQPLSDQQRAYINGHPEKARDLLVQSGFRDEALLRAVLEHHERVDGSGYPMGLKQDDISMDARILGIVDSFSAMVRSRAYREAVHCKQALRDIFIQRSKSADERLANLFVKEVGMYPPGSVVKLASGDVAVVFRRGAKVACPLVRVFMYVDGNRALTHPMRDTGEKGSEVVESLAAKKYVPILSSIGHLWSDRVPA